MHVCEGGGAGEVRVSVCINGASNPESAQTLAGPAPYTPGLISPNPCRPQHPIPQAFKPWLPHPAAFRCTCVTSPRATTSTTMSWRDSPGA